MSIQIWITIDIESQIPVFLNPTISFEGKQGERQLSRSSYLSFESFDLVCPADFSHLFFSISPLSPLSFSLSESTSSSRSHFFKS